MFSLAVHLALVPPGTAPDPSLDKRAEVHIAVISQRHQLPSLTPRRVLG